jgi:uncharacterized protein YndB with AHSA1/START domain
MNQKVAQSDPAEGSREVIERELARHPTPKRELTRAPIAKTGMLVRRPVAQVFEAIVNPAVTSKFWFSQGSGRLDQGRPVTWTWESHNVSIEVTPKIVEPNKRVQIEWPGYTGQTVVEWSVEALPDNTTFVRVSESGWIDDADKLVRYVADSTHGFTLLLAGLKAWQARHPTEP